jgi:sugar lactone lactonase YvrE
LFIIEAKLITSLNTTRTTTASDPTTTALVTSALTSSPIYTTISPYVTTTIIESKWNLTGITVASGNKNSSILSPYAVFVDDNYYIYIAEKDNSRISKWPPNLNGTASGAVYQTASGQLNKPPSLYVKAATGDIYVADESNNRVVLFANGSTTGFVMTGALSGSSFAVNAIYLDPNGTVVVGDSSRNRLYNWYTNQTMAGGQGSGSSANQFNGLKRFFIDSNYSMYVTDSTNVRVQKWSRGAASGETVAGGYSPGSGANQLSAPLGVVVDSQGNILVCDTGNHRVQKWSYGATTGQTVAGNSNGIAGSGSNELNSPKGIALDKDDNLYVADYTNLRIQKFEVL